MQPFELRLSLSRTEVVASLAAFGRDWHESKMPGALRKAGFYGCSVTMDDNRFDMYLLSQGRGSGIRCIGTIESNPNGTGSLVHGELAFTKQYIWFVVIVCAVATIAIGKAWINDPEPTPGHLVTGFLKVVVGVLIWRIVNIAIAGRYRGMYELVLKEAVGGSSSRPAA